MSKWWRQYNQNPCCSRRQSSYIKPRRNRKENIPFDKTVQGKVEGFFHLGFINMLVLLFDCFDLFNTREVIFCAGMQILADAV